MFLFSGACVRSPSPLRRASLRQTASVVASLWVVAVLACPRPAAFRAATGRGAAHCRRALRPRPGPAHGCVCACRYYRRRQRAACTRHLHGARRWLADWRQSHGPRGAGEGEPLGAPGLHPHLPITACCLRPVSAQARDVQAALVAAQQRASTWGGIPAASSSWAIWQAPIWWPCSTPRAAGPARRGGAVAGRRGARQCRDERARRHARAAPAAV